MALVFIKYLLLVSISATVYFLIPKRIRWTVLLVASYLYYWSNSGILILILFAATLNTFLFGLWLENNRKVMANLPAELSKEEKKAAKDRTKKKGKRILTFGILLDLSFLLFLKYYNFFGSNLNIFLDHFGYSIPLLSLLLPLGISFYTLQAIAYLVDVNRGKISADRSLPRFMLFLSFFPQITQGPIARHHQLASQLYEGHDFDFKRVCFGLQLILWGMMKKLILADRIAGPVAYLFDHYAEFHGLEVLFAGALYGLQVYADFSGAMDIARGAAQIFGIDLELNFRQPYFSHSIDEFWRRWHITLGAWMREYVFYPLSLSKVFAKLGKKSRKHFGSFVGNRLPTFLSMFIVFFLVGFWHGAEWKYIAYGVWNGIIITSSILLTNAYSGMLKGLHIDESNWGWKGFQLFRTIVLCSAGRVFSRGQNLKSAWQMLRSVFDRWYDVSFLVDGTLIDTGLNTAGWFISLIAMLILLSVDLLHEKDTQIRESIAKQHVVFRWTIYLGAVIALIIFGVYGTGDLASGFIYEQF